MTRIKSREFIRKFIHFGFIIIPLAYRYLFHSNRKSFLLFLIPLTFISLITDILRLKHKTFSRIFHDLVGILLRKHELNDITGATYMMISALICVLIFPADIAFVALAFLAIGDTLAAVIGMQFGKHKLAKTDKTWEGTIACFAGTLGFALFFLQPITAIAGALTATLAEVSKISIDDNLKIPIGSGVVMTLINVVLS